MSGKKLLLPTVGAAVVLAGGAAAYMYLKGPAKDGTSPLAIAKTVPDEAYLVAFVSSDPQNWTKLQQFGTPEAKQVVSKGLQTIKQDLLAKNNIDFDKDIKPWVGNGMIALLPNESKPDAPSTLVVVNIRDKIAAMQFAGKLANQGSKSKEAEYKGNKILFNEANSTYATVVKDFLMVAQDQKTIEAAVDTAQGAPSLASKPGAENILNKGVDVPNAIAQVYLLDYSDATQKLMNLSKEDSASSINLQEMQKVQSIVAGVGVDDEGLRMKASITMSPDAPKFDYQPVPGKVVAQFPAETLAMVSGGNISRIWTQATQQVKSDPMAEQTLNTARESAKAANFDLDKDIFGWMDGEFGIALIPSDRGILSQVGFGGVMVFDTSDRKTAEATFAKLDEFARSNAMLVQQRDVQGKKVTEWSSPMMPGSILGHGWLDDDSLFVALGGPMVEVATAKPSQALDSSTNFKAATGSLPKQNLGYLYVDMDKTMTLVNRFAALTQSPIPPDSAAVLNSIKGIGMTSTQVNASTGEVDVLLALKKTK
ncbi:Protein of unknown function (DUF3352) [Leptolyngbyaceae cyanobacterium JSC-12]|nr:Protein of unknown function (DUF3352) [Leptolyngbyaceae cyanobacterium JSC-12]